MKRVIAALDNSAAARPVVTVAMTIAPVLGAAAEAVHVAEDGDQTARAAARDAGLALETVRGDPVERLVALADEIDVVALVVGAKGCPTGPGPAGHVALAVANATATPVVVVNPDCEVAPRLERVVIALEGTAANSRSLKRAVELAAGYSLDIVAVHVDDETTIPSFSDQVQHETEAYTTEFLARFLPGVTRVRVEFRVGDPTEEILKVVEEAGGQMLAIGWPQSGDPRRGVVAREIVRRSRRPVFLAALAGGKVGG